MRLTEHERLPVKLGWKTSSTQFSENDLFAFMQRVVNATTLSAEEKDAVRRTPDLHLGMQVR